MSSRSTRRSAAALMAVLALLAPGALAGCGGEDSTSAADTTAEETDTATDPATDDTSTTTPDDPEIAIGRTVFAETCGGCHTLQDAGTSGDVGPSLDGAGLTADAVEQQVREGGGDMPSFENRLTDTEIEQVSAYVATTSR